MEINFVNFILEQNIIIVAALYCIGMFIKQSPIKDKLIPFVILICGIILCVISGGLNVGAVMQGVFCAAAAVFTNQIFKQLDK